MQEPALLRVPWGRHSLYRSGQLWAEDGREKWGAMGPADALWPSGSSPHSVTRAARSRASLSLSFFICRMGMIAPALPSHGHGMEMRIDSAPPAWIKEEGRRKQTKKSNHGKGRHAGDSGKDVTVYIP